MMKVNTMMRTKPSTLTSLTVGLALLLAIAGSGLLITKVSAAPDKAAPAQKVADNLLTRTSHSNGDERVNIILQVDSVTGPLKALLNRNGVHVNKQFKNFNAYAIELPSSAIAELASFDEVRFVSFDDEVVSLGHVSSTTGADDVRSQTTGGVSYTLD